jgi:hypothetical protein
MNPPTSVLSQQIGHLLRQQLVHDGQARAVAAGWEARAARVCCDTKEGFPMGESFDCQVVW